MKYLNKKDDAYDEFEKNKLKSNRIEGRHGDDHLVYTYWVKDKQKYLTTSYVDDSHECIVEFYETSSKEEALAKHQEIIDILKAL